jgi:prepilin-type N-terminal cleavage/methylation domain-containing protein/prepilin-type processing-associated H-X9-DG protein
MPKSSIRCAGFSLIELLVVIAIIAVLVAMLTSINDSVRTSTVTLRCANNLRQIGLGMQVFAQGHQGRLPTLNIYPEPAGHWRAYWFHQVYAEIGDDGAVKLFKCPGNKRARSSWNLTDGKWIEGFSSYAMPTNDTYARPGLAQNCPVTWNYRNQSLLTSRRFAEIAPDSIIVTEMWDNQEREAGLENQWNWQPRLLQSAWEVALEPHRNRNNYLYADGSVSNPRLVDTIGPNGWLDRVGGDMQGGWTITGGD